MDMKQINISWLCVCFNFFEGQIRVIGIIECEESFVIAISHPVSTTITFILIEIGDEEASETQIEVTITRKSLLVRIPKEKFRSNKLIRGNLYSLHVSYYVIIIAT